MTLNYNKAWRFDELNYAITTKKQIFDFKNKLLLLKLFYEVSLCSVLNRYVTEMAWQWNFWETETVGLLSFPECGTAIELVAQ